MSKEKIDKQIRLEALVIELQSLTNNQKLQIEALTTLKGHLETENRRLKNALDLPT